MFLNDRIGEEVLDLLSFRVGDWLSLLGDLLNLLNLLGDPEAFSLVGDFAGVLSEFILFLDLPSLPSLELLSETFKLLLVRLRLKMFCNDFVGDVNSSVFISIDPWVSLFDCFALWELMLEPSALLKWESRQSSFF